MSWTDNLTANSGDFETLKSLLTKENGEALESIYSRLEQWCVSQSLSFNDLINRNMNVAIGDGISNSAIASLSAMGFLVSSDFIHIGITPLGIEFIQAMRSQENPTP